MVSFRPTCPVTDEELDQLSRTNPGVRFERGAQGELIVSPTGTLGGLGESELFSQVNAWARQDGEGVAVVASVGFTLPDGSVFAPDAAWVSRERWNALSQKERNGYAHTAPDVAFELLSSDDTFDGIRSKASAYLRNETRLVVLIDPLSHVTELHRTSGVFVSHDDEMSLTPELDGFTLEQISKRRSRPSSALYVLLYTAGRRLNGYDVRKSALDIAAIIVCVRDGIEFQKEAAADFRLNTLRAPSAPTTGNPAGSSNPICTSTLA
jgi:Uma2 family endonuclease